MGQRTKSTQPGPPHTGRPHDPVNLEKSKHDLHGHSKAYKYTLEEEKKEIHGRGSRELLKES
ncbi:Rho GTPase-activating 5 [Gossypium arboreum]|uniref:Rho GTPase-activating 5 n=1 Tax=Gossypium arboreum TaxID=29729 RepID=A0A0B0N9Y3_GOSAR|nr:Rho GTPase-activating 5 [Gossypium arboreum]